MAAGIGEWRRGRIRMGLGAMVMVVFAWVGMAGAAKAGEQQPAQVAGVSAAEAMRLGEKIYRQGILPSGEPAQGMVRGDIPVDGTMFTCVSCHLRSGFGTSEGKVRTPPIDGLRLYSPVSAFRGMPMVGPTGYVAEDKDFRPAYTDATLAAAMETGVDPAGRQMNSTMPMYSLSKRDMDILVYYLKNLSVDVEPGVTETSLRFATVYSDEVPVADRESMLNSITNFVKNWRVPTPRMERTIRSVSHRKEGEARGLRTLELSVWELKGQPQTWEAQLEEYYKKEPVFAILGGISTREWTPIHRFCEGHKVPNLFPLTNFPVISTGDWYTLYLSKGLSQEAETAARYLHKQKKGAAPAVIQVFRDDLAGRTLSKAFQETWVALGNKAPEARVLKAGETWTANDLDKMNGASGPLTLVLWLQGEGFPDLTALAKKQNTVTVVASATQLGSALYTLPEAVRPLLSVTYPYSLPKESTGFRSQADPTLPEEKLPSVQRQPALKLYAVYQVLSAPLSKLRSFVHRDYFMELLETSPDLATTPVIYPRLSFGQGQRYAVKGCYMVALSAGSKPELIKKSDWVAY